MAVVNSRRLASGLPPAGLLNPILYRTPAVQATFGDIREDRTPSHAAENGWDYPTGWGAPNAAGLAATLP
jgi:kumamolisin